MVQPIKPGTKTKEVPTAEAVPTKETEMVDKAALTSLDQVTTKDLILHLVKSATTVKRKTTSNPTVTSARGTTLPRSRSRRSADKTMANNKRSAKSQSSIQKTRIQLL